MLYPKGPCTQIVYTLALKYSLYRYVGTKVYSIWVHGPLGLSPGIFNGSFDCVLRPLNVLRAVVEAEESGKSGADNYTPCLYMLMSFGLGIGFRV